MKYRKKQEDITKKEKMHFKLLLSGGDNKMDFIDELKQFSSQVSKIKDSLQTEEATKMSLILPFFQLLGYNVFAVSYTHLDVYKRQDVSSAEITGGENPSVDNEGYSDALLLLEPYRWNTICVDTDSTDVHNVLSAYMQRDVYKRQQKSW